MRLRDTCIFLLLIFVVKFILLNFKYYNRSFITVFDVGQGDAILISLGEGFYRKNIVIDGGPTFEISRYMSKFSLTPTCKIDLLVLTHPHFDHMAGIERLFLNCQIDYLLFDDIEYESRSYMRLRSLLNVKKGTTVLKPYAGQIIRVGKSYLYVLWPKANKTYYDNVNNASIVFYFKYKNTDAIFTGDAEEYVLNDLANENLSEVIDGSIDILKVAHHGSNDALSKTFLSKIKPDLCIISSGKNNKFKHPHSDLLSFLSEIKCTVLRTDIAGSIEVFLD